jgi:hypothetical protein
MAFRSSAFSWSEALANLYCSRLKSSIGPSSSKSNAAAIGHALHGGYADNPLERIAYQLQSRFERNIAPFSVERLIKQHLAQINAASVISNPSMSLSGGIPLGFRRLISIGWKRICHPDHRRTRADTHALYAARTRTEAAARATQVHIATAAAAENHCHPSRLRYPSVVQTFGGDPSINQLLGCALPRESAKSG